MSTRKNGKMQKLLITEIEHCADITIKRKNVIKHLIWGTRLTDWHKLNIYGDNCVSTKKNVTGFYISQYSLNTIQSCKSYIRKNITETYPPCKCPHSHWLDTKYKI